MLALPTWATRTTDAQIKSLRRKLGNAARLIETVRGIGYRYASTTSPFASHTYPMACDHSF